MYGSWLSGNAVVVNSYVAEAIARDVRVEHRDGIKVRLEGIDAACRPHQVARVNCVRADVRSDVNDVHAGREVPLEKGKHIVGAFSEVTHEAAEAVVGPCLNPIRTQGQFSRLAGSPDLLPEDNAL